MTSRLDFASVTRAVDLIHTPYVLAILDGIGDGAVPADTVPDDADAGLVRQAVRQLLDHGVARIETGDGSDLDRDRLLLTARGQRLLQALRGPSRYRSLVDL